MPQRRIIIKEARRIPRFIERVKGNPLPRVIDILGKPKMVGLVSEGDRGDGSIDDNDGSLQKEKDPEYFLPVPAPHNLCEVVK